MENDKIKNQLCSEAIVNVEKICKEVLPFIQSKIAEAYIKGFKDASNVFSKSAKTK